MTNRVLIVDDSRQMRELIKMTLAGVAEVVGECADGADALDCYEANRPDWILMDWEMKRMDGDASNHRVLPGGADYHVHQLQRRRSSAGGI